MIFYLLHYITTSKKKKPKKNRTEEDLEVLRKVTSDEKRQSYLLHVEVVFYHIFPYFYYYRQPGKLCNKKTQFLQFFHQKF